MDKLNRRMLDRILMKCSISSQRETRERPVTDLIMKTGALGRAAHPAVAGEEAAAAAEREAVSGVVAEELGRAGRGQRHQAAGLRPGLAVVGALGAGDGAEVCHPG